MALRRELGSRTVHYHDKPLRGDNGPQYGYRSSWNRFPIPSNAYTNGEQAARSLDELARNALFTAYFGGNTRGA